VIFMAHGEMAACGSVKVIVAIVNVRFHVRTSGDYDAGPVSVPRPPFAEQPEQIP
jgi:hypothetical protein